MSSERQHAAAGNGWADKGYSERDAQAQSSNRTDRLAELYTKLLEEVGEDPTREGLLKTPARAAGAIEFITQGYRQTVDDVLNEAVFEEDADGIVIVRDIEFYSMCEHHLLPFYGKCHVAYIPAGRIIGLSKIPRLVDMYGRRLQIQERLTAQIAHALDKAIGPHGVAVVTEAAHMCMMIRGVEKQHSSTVSSCVLGAFRDDMSTRAEFFHLIGMRRGHE